MNYSANQVITGLINYADHEVMNKLPVTGKWVVGTAITLGSNKVNNIIEVLKENTIVNMLGVIDEEGNIDVDAIITALKDSAEKYGNVTVEVPMVGRLTFSSTDVERLKSYMV